MVKVSVHIYLISKKKRGIKMYIDYQILSVVEDMSANPQSKFDGMNCTPIALGRYDDSSKILCLSATQTNFPHLSNDKKYNIIARNKENQKTESFSEHIITTGASASSSITVPQYKKRSKKQA